MTSGTAMHDVDNAEVTPPGPLAGVRVLDLTDEIAVLGGRLLAAIGADVLRPEPPGGDGVRRRPPIVDGGDRGGRTSLAHVTYNSGKRSIVVDCSRAGDEQIVQLAAAADIVLLSRDSTYVGAFERRGRDFATAHPGCAFVVVEPFPSGAFGGWQATDLVLSAMGGFAWLCGELAGPPEHPKGQMAFAYTGAAAALAGMAGLISRERTGRAGWFELTGQEAVAFSTFQSGDPNPLCWYGTVPGRGDWTQTAQRALHQCRDGRWCTFVMLGAHFDQLAGWLSEAGVSDDFLSEAWLDRDYYLEHQPDLTAAIGELCRRYDRDDVVRLGQLRRLMVMPVTTVHELLADAQLDERQMLVPTATATGSIRLPRAPAVFSLSAVPPPRPAPALGEHTPAAADEWLRPRVPGIAVGDGQGRRLPLEGLRVADFSWMLAAPIATRFLADLGADVIRIESHARRDMTREIGPQPPGYFSLDTNSTQHHASSNKRSIALDLNHPEAVALAREIISRSDVVFENFTPGTMAKWGLEPQSLLREWPGLVVVSQPAVGYTGPHRTWGAIGNGVAGYGGINMLTGFPHNPPFGVGPIVADFAAPLFSATALLAALHYRWKTGRGQHVDCGMLEATLWLLDVAFAEAQVTRSDPARSGNRSAWMSPHGIFPSAGDEAWVAIAVRSDDEWVRTAEVLGQPALARDPRFATFPARKEHEDELEALVAQLTRGRDRWELSQALQRAGVPAGPVEHVGDHLKCDAGMAGRFSSISHPYGFEFLIQTQFIRPEGEVVPNRRAPMIGEHSEAILRDLLDQSQEEITELVIKGILN
jgi:crotonobetainyl-CoA:carnitine CoA-transferase CaiB-like acyl-CoA transferase